MKINNRKELQHIAINHSADNGYNVFVTIYRECSRKPYSFLTTDTTLPGSDPLGLKKNLFQSYKNDNSWSDQIFRQKNYTNEAQYDSDRKAAKISALPSNNLDKHEYLTGEDLDLKQSTVTNKQDLSILHWLIF